jgi:predicted AAA+ superfamily ATPase
LRIILGLRQFGKTTLAEMIAQQWVKAEPVHRYDLESQFLV